MSNKIKEKFNDAAQNYDKQRKKLIPCFDDLYNIPISLIEGADPHCSVLDIGGGTGLFSMFLLQKYPEAKVTLIDLAENMLEIAKQRFKDNPNIEYVKEDYTKYCFDKQYDIVISSLSIHHLDDNQKQNLYKTCHTILKPEGLFINADQILPSTKHMDRLSRKIWKAYIESSDLSQDEIAAAYDRMRLDKEAKVEDQLIWLKETGFVDVECVFKYYNFAVMFGRKK